MLKNPKWDKPDAVSDVLLKAADLIDQRGHAKMVRVDPSTRAMCFLGAIGVANGDENGMSWSIESHELEGRAAKAVADFLGIRSRPGGSDIRYDIVAWNNAPERTKEEVVDAMRMTAYRRQLATWL